MFRGLKRVGTSVINLLIPFRITSHVLGSLLLLVLLAALVEEMLEHLELG